MEETKLREIINVGETQEVELKQSFHSSQDFSKLMCGLANTFGGMIIVGVTSHKTVVGIDEDLDGLQQKISACAQAVSPAVIPLIEVNILEGKKVIVVTIQKAIDTIQDSSDQVFSHVVQSLERRQQTLPQEQKYSADEIDQRVNMEFNTLMRGSYLDDDAMEALEGWANK